MFDLLEKIIEVDEVEREIEDTRVSFDKVPRYVYIGLSRDWYEGWPGWSGKPIKQFGIETGKKGQFSHTMKRADSVYMAVYKNLAARYASLYSDPMILRIDTDKLDKNKFYYDPLDVGTIENPFQLAYRGNIPSQAIMVEKDNV